MVTAGEFAERAQSSAYDGITYAQLDCQAFVERVLKDCGVRNARDKPYDWQGTNGMWRNALFWKGTLDECRTKFGCIPFGAWVFIVKHDGGEIARGYHDTEGNASHVGIYCRTGAQPVRDSTRGGDRDGVGYRSLAAFTHVGLPKMLSFDNAAFDDKGYNRNELFDNIGSALTNALSMLSELRRMMEG